MIASAANSKNKHTLGLRHSSSGSRERLQPGTYKHTHTDLYKSEETQMGIHMQMYLTTHTSVSSEGMLLTFPSSKMCKYTHRGKSDRDYLKRT